MKIAKAAAYSARKHHGQFRKDGITPYFYHCSMVAMFTQQYCTANNYDYIEDMICAAYLHDTIEDCGVKSEEIIQEFGEQVAGYVIGLTNVYTKEAYPHMNREARKKAECLRLTNLSKQVQEIKLADRLANVIDLYTLDHGFKNKFIDETKLLVRDIGCANLHVSLLIMEKLV